MTRNIRADKQLISIKPGSKFAELAEIKGLQLFEDLIPTGVSVLLRFR